MKKITKRTWTLIVLLFVISLSIGILCSALLSKSKAAFEFAFGLMFVSIGAVAALEKVLEQVADGLVRITVAIFFLSIPLGGALIIADGVRLQLHAEPYFGLVMSAVTITIEITVMRFTKKHDLKLL